MDLICIDMDNTLIDSDKAHILSYNKAFENNNLKKVSSKVMTKYFGLVGFEIIKKLFPKLDNKETLKVLDDSHSFFVNDTIKYLKPFKNIKKTLIILKKKYELALISNARKVEILKSLKAAKINPKIFDVLVGSDEVKRPKPFPDIVLRAEHIMNKKAIYVIGDSIYDIKAGKKAKIKTIGVLTGNHTKEQLKKEKADFIFKNFDEVLRIL